MRLLVGGKFGIRFFASPTKICPNLVPLARLIYRGTKMPCSDRVTLEGHLTLPGLGFLIHKMGLIIEATLKGY